jgi:hypothetical protein
MVEPGTRDPLGLLYAMRAVDWQHAPDFHSQVYEGHDLYEIAVHCEDPNDSARTAVASYPAARVSIRVFQYGREVTAIHFVGWIANDAAHTPVVMEADLPFGKLRAELLSRPQ